MRDRFNVRVLELPTLAEVEREVARIEPYTERVAATAPKGLFHLIHAAGLSSTGAMILKQELLALDADCVIAPDVYLGDRQAVTDAVIMASLRQYRGLIARLRLFPLNELAQLADELEQVLGGYSLVPESLKVGRVSFDWGERTYIMGIVNVTPDSFSGDGVLATAQGGSASGTWVERAVDQATGFAADGADILDVGGESTRPGAAPVAAADELARVVPVIAALRDAVAVPISVDTFKAEVAAAALDAGADLVNDVWGLRRPEGGWNEALARLVAERNAPIVLMHHRVARAVAGQIGGHYQDVAYDDLLGRIMRELRESIAFAEEQGIHRSRIIVDPGIGFGKTPAQNIELLRQLGQVRSLGRPILLGTSRKSFIGRALNLGVDERVEGTGATVTLGIQAGADIVRVHDVAAMTRVARMTDAVIRPGAWERVIAGQP